MKQIFVSIYVAEVWKSAVGMSELLNSFFLTLLVAGWRPFDSSTYEELTEVPTVL